LRYAVSLGLMALFLYWAFRDIDAEALWAAMQQASPMWLGIIVLTTLVTIVLRAWRWLVLMRPFTTSVTIWEASQALALCYGANFFLPRSGEALRVVSLKWRHSMSMGSTAATVVVERIIDMVWLTLFVGISVLFLRTRIEVAFPWLGPWVGSAVLVALAACVAVLTLLTLVSIFRDRALEVVRRMMRPLPPRISSTVVDALGKFAHGLEALHTPSAYVEILVSSVLLNAGYILLIYEGFIAFGFHTDYNLGAMEALVIMAISSLGIVAPVPGGTGPYHFLFSQSLLLLFAVPAAAALACATTVHALANLLYLGLSGPALLLLRRRRRRE
jgi:uncharacterized protein (TIRG00374 family)